MAWTIVAPALYTFRTLMFDGFPFPPPTPADTGMGHTAGTAEAFLLFMSGYLLLVMTIIWMLPKKWSGPVSDIAFGVRSEPPEE